MEGGVQYYRNNVNLRVVYFSRNIKDNILFYSAGAPTYASYYINGDEQKDKGLELEASVDFGKVDIIANYVNLDGSIKTKIASKDTSFFNLYRRPRQAINLHVGIDVCKGLNVNLGVQSISKRYEPVYMSVPVEMPAYYTWNLYATYIITKNVQLFADIKNITDEKYSEIRGYNNRRANFMAGVNVTF
jgi:vitamin B12 transporter